MTFQIRNRPFNKADLEYLAGYNLKGVLNQIAYTNKSPYKVEEDLAKECLFYRNHIEAIQMIIDEGRNYKTKSGIDSWGLLKIVLSLIQSGREEIDWRQLLK